MLEETGRSGARPVVILLTDGEQTFGGGDVKARDIATALKEKLRIVAIGFGDAKEGVVVSGNAFPPVPALWPGNHFASEPTATFGRMYATALEAKADLASLMDDICEEIQ